MLDITGSIVLYKNNTDLVKEAINSFLATGLNVQLYLIDNSPTDELSVLNTDPRILYIKNDKNVGFGKAHNIALKKAVEHSKYHLVLNPDIYFPENTLEKLFDYMESNQNVGQIMPKVLYPDGQTQHLCKLLPTPADLFLRRFMPGLKSAEKRNHQYELRDSGYNKIMNVPYLSGCFMFLRSSTLKEIGLFDERIFMYIEDADLTRRIHAKYKTLYYPVVHVFHHYAKGSYKNLKLMLYNIHGAIIYFNKYGWFFDSKRKKINKKVINDLKST